MDMHLFASASTDPQYYAFWSLAFAFLMVWILAITSESSNSTCVLKDPSLNSAYSFYPIYTLQITASKRLKLNGVKAENWHVSFKAEYPWLPNASLKAFGVLQIAFHA